MDVYIKWFKKLIILKENSFCFYWVDTHIINLDITILDHANHNLLYLPIIVYVTSERII